LPFHDPEYLPSTAEQADPMHYCGFISSELVYHGHPQSAVAEEVAIHRLSRSGVSSARYSPANHTRWAAHDSYTLIPVFGARKTAEVDVGLQLDVKPDVPQVIYVRANADPESDAAAAVGKESQPNRNHRKSRKHAHMIQYAATGAGLESIAGNPSEMSGFHLNFFTGCVAGSPERCSVVGGVGKYHYDSHRHGDLV
jgi:hypothetical protein